jgi:hypothetical protein
VDALAKVLKKSLISLFPEIDQVKLIDFSSRIFDPGAGTAAGVEVEILFSNGKDAWRVKAFSENIKNHFVTLNQVLNLIQDLRFQGLELDAETSSA